MAILGLVPGLEVCVKVDGKPLEEHACDEVALVDPSPVAEHQRTRTVTKYVESTTNKDFEIELILHTTYKMTSPSLSCPISVDGTAVAAPLFTKQHFSFSRHNRPVSTIRRVVEGVDVEAPGRNDGKVFVKKFQFSNIEIDETRQKDIREDAEKIKNVGQIVVKVFRASQPIPGSFQEYSVFGDATRVHEKALKGQAKSHSTSFGPADSLRTVSSYHVHHLNGDGYPIAQFVFKYRSREALKQLLVIERTPSPDPEEPPLADLENLNATQRAKLNRFLRDLVHPGRASSSTPDRTIKREREIEVDPPRKKRPSGKKVVIDLTGVSDADDDE